MEQTISFTIFTSFFSGATLTFLILTYYRKCKLKTITHLTDSLLQKAEQEANYLKQASEIEIKKKHLEQQNQFEAFCQKENKKLSEKEERIKKKEDQLESRINLFEKKLLDLDKQKNTLLETQQKLNENKEKIHHKELSLIEELEKASCFSAKEAKEYLLKKVQEEIQLDTSCLIRKKIEEAQENAEIEAKRIITTAIMRLAVPCVSESTIHTVQLPNDDMKGRIIGREGKNIRLLERLTGTNFLIDDTPNAVVISGFDPLRLHIAKTTLTDLVFDGRIHPTRIEEVYEKAKLKTQELIKKFGEDASQRAGVMNLHPEIIILLGKLKFRTSLGQNVLDHSLEVSHIMRIMALELGLDDSVAKRIGLLHDIGKAVSHEVEGTHAVIGHDIALKYGEEEVVANGIGCHHFEMEPISIEGSLCHCADAISASRPGARAEAVEEYIKRLKNLEKIAYSFPGVETAYALQAGRELRIFVIPDQIDDEGAFHLAKQLTKKVEKDLKYNGKVKISVTREKRIVEYAL